MVKTTRIKIRTVPIENAAMMEGDIGSTRTTYTDTRTELFRCSKPGLNATTVRLYGES